MVLALWQLNLWQLEPGQAVFTGPGVLYAYLEGLGIELMPIPTTSCAAG